MRMLLIAVVVGAGIAGCELKAQERRPVPEEILQKSKLAFEALYEKCFREMPNIQGLNCSAFWRTVQFVLNCVFRWKWSKTSGC